MRPTSCTSVPTEVVMNTKALSFAVGAALACSLGAANAQAQDNGRPGGSPPAGERGTFEPQPQPNRLLLFSGAGVFAASYVPSFVVVAASDRDGDGWLYVPVLGPWGDLAARDGCGPNSCGREALNKILLIASGAAQVVGVGGVVASFFVPESQTKITAT